MTHPCIRTRAVAGSLFLALMVAEGCASKTQSVAAIGKVVQITPSSAGKTVTLHVGDTLWILLGPPLGGSLLRWQLRSYPKDVLRLATQDQARGRFEFVAHVEGSGDINLVGLVRCEGPAPQAAGVQCPVQGGGSGAGPPGTASPVPSGSGDLVPLQLFTFKVVVRG